VIVETKECGAWQDSKAEATFYNPTSHPEWNSTSISLDRYLLPGHGQALRGHSIETDTLNFPTWEPEPSKASRPTLSSQDTWQTPGFTAESSPADRSSSTCWDPLQDWGSKLPVPVQNFDHKGILGISLIVTENTSISKCLDVALCSH
jgi:hypothetical protein